MERKIIVKMEGGLGNQMFQYAHAVSLQKELGGKIVLDKHAFTKKQIRSFSLDNYILGEGTFMNPSLCEKAVIYFYILFARYWNKKKKLYSLEGFRHYSKYGLCFQYQMRWFDSIIKPRTKYIYVSGNWMSEKFFENAVEEAKNAFVLKNHLDSRLDGILNEIKTTESVCIHVRLGDYLAPQWKDKLFVCTPDYYHKAILIIKEHVTNPRFFVFSNRHKDFEMIKKEYELDDVTYVDMGNTDVEDMELMRNCRHFIMSNSTYSWWSQYLSANTKKVVVAPSRFNNFPRWDMSDIYSNDWITVGV